MFDAPLLPTVGDRVQVKVQDQYGAPDFYVDGTLVAIGIGDGDGYYEVVIDDPVPYGYIQTDWYSIDEVIA